MNRRVLLFLVSLLLIPPSQASLPQALRDLGAPAPWRSLGQGELRWFGLKVYHATLWVAGEGYSPDQPFALSLTYARAFDSDKLVATSVSEMERLGWRDEAALAQWRQELERVFPDVRAGETLVGVSLPGRGAHFFHQERSLGEVVDPEFARAFFAIWLDPRTRVPGLRSQLLGAP